MLRPCRLPHKINQHASPTMASESFQINPTPGPRLCSAQCFRAIGLPSGELIQNSRWGRSPEAILRICMSSKQSITGTVLCILTLRVSLATVSALFLTIPS